MERELNSMDRPIGEGERRARILRRGGVAVLVTAAVAVAVIAVLGWIRPSVDRDDIRTAVVDRGVIEATITASGRVVPEYEHVITSPVDTRVTRILKTPGDSLQPGEPIVELDVSQSRLALEKMDDRIALKEIERERARQDLQGKVSGWRGQKEIKTLELRSLEYEAERCRQNLEAGIFSRDELRRAENDAERARIELRQIEETMAHAERVLETQLRELDLELGILRKERDEAAHDLELAAATADRVGVLTWVVASEGTAVRKGDEIARLADLSSFRVEATVSDVHGSRVAPGLTAVVRSGDTIIRGRVESVRPTVENGVITMDVTLENSRHPVLRHNLRVDVFIVTDRVDDALRLKRGSYLNLEGRHAVFVVRGDRAVRTPVTFGITNFEQFQILDGLSEGDEVIISDMSQKKHVREVRLK